MVNFNFVGQSKLTTFAKSRKWDDDETVKMDFQGKGGVGKTNLKLPNIKTDMAVTGGLTGNLRALSQIGKGWKRQLAGATIGAGLGAGTTYLLRKRDMDGRSDKGKKRKY